MTRETKIGLVVACSFLCLVGVVVASKLRRGEDPSEEQTVIIAANKPAQVVNDTKAKDGPKGETQPTPTPPKKDETPKGSSPLLSFPPITNPPPKDDINKLLNEAKKSGTPGTVEFPPLPSNGPPVFRDSTPAPSTFAPPPSPVLPVTKQDGPPLPAPPVVTIRPDPITPNAPAPFAPLPGVSGPVEIPTPVIPAPKDNPPIVAKDSPPAFPSLGKDAPPAFPALGKDPAPAFPPTPVAKEPPLVFPSVAKDPSPAFPPAGREVPPITIGPSSPSVGPVPTIPPVAVVGSKPLPTVRDSSVQTVDAVKGETTFPVLSMRLYGTDRYADALLAHNRKYSDGVKDGHNFNFNPPILNEKQKVLFPTRESLERDYPTLIRQASIDPIPTTPAVVPTVKLTPPTPLSTPGAVTPISVPPSAGPTRDYRVQNPMGESILDIAERTLGNRSRWNDIYQLNRANPAVAPQFRIPAGTDLKIPSN